MHFKKRILFTLFLTIVICGSNSLSAQEVQMNPEEATEKIISQFKQQYDFVPQPLLLLAEREGAVPGFMKYGTSLMVNGPLTPRDINLITLSAAVALKSPGCTANQIRKLKKLNVSNDEILQTVYLSAILANTSTLSEAYKTLKAESIIQDIKE